MNSKSTILTLASAVGFALVTGCATNDPVTKANTSFSDAGKISQKSHEALQTLYAHNSGARDLGRKAKGVLVFPAILKGGFIVGAQGGNGTLLLNNGSVGGYYQTVSASWGLQAGVQKFGYALFFMNDSSLRNLERRGGWELGGSPNVVVVDRGLATSLSTTTADKNVYAYFFDQRGLMGGLTVEGTKITRIHTGQ